MSTDPTQPEPSDPSPSPADSAAPAAPAKPAPAPADLLVRLCSCVDAAEVNAIRGLLAAHEVDCYVHGESRRANLGVLSGYTELNILVREPDLKRAAALIGAQHADEPVGHRPAADAPNEKIPLCLEHAAPGELRCSQCGRGLCEECERELLDPHHPEAGVICAECADRKTKDNPVPNDRARKALIWILAAAGGPVLVYLLLKLGSLFAAR